tara:strand:- start:2 stop:859 length:858 start_codon:yes stop_codon:yes gene_type:complete
MSNKQKIMQETTYGEDGSISIRQSTVEERKEQYAKMGIPSMELMDGSVIPDIGKMGAEKIPQALQMTRENLIELGASPDGERIAMLDELIASPDVQPKAIQNTLNRLVPGSQEQVLGDLGDSISSRAKMKFASGGLVPYSNPFVLGTGHNVLNIAPDSNIGFNKGGEVPGQGNTDTVPAMLTPGEIVMSKGAVEKFGAENLLEMNKAGGGTNKPTLMKFAGGGMVPGIDPPSGRGNNVIVMGGGGKKSPSTVSSSGAGQVLPSFSSTNPNNVTIPVVKSLYNIMS